MIPYIEIPSLHIWGPFEIEPFGFLVVTGCIVGFLVARWHVGTLGLDQGEVRSLVLIWVLVPAFVLSHLISMVLYFPEALVRQPLSLIYIGRSMSSFGGFFGGALGAVIYLRRKKLPAWEYCDSLVLGLVVGWLFGRLGCTIVHDHPGLPSDFLLAVQFPIGPRHDLGLYEWLFTIFLNFLVFFIRRRRLPPGSIIGIISVLYAPIRFMLDFLRVGDKLYLGLTPGQYFSVLLMVVGIWALTRAIKGQTVGR